MAGRPQDRFQGRRAARRGGRLVPCPGAGRGARSEALVGLRDDGAIELIGLSNVDVRHLDLAAEHAEVSCVQDPTSSLAHLEENLGAGDVALGDEHMAVLDGLAAEHQSDPRQTFGDDG